MSDEPNAAALDVDAGYSLPSFGANKGSGGAALFMLSGYITVRSYCVDQKAPFESNQSLIFRPSVVQCWFVILSEAGGKKLLFRESKSLIYFFIGIKRNFAHHFQTMHAKCQSVARSTSPCSTPNPKGTKRETEGRVIWAAALHVRVIFELFCCIQHSKKKKKEKWIGA